MKTSFRGYIRIPRLQRGDTIVEVMVAMTILGLVLGAAFVTSRHSLQSGLQSSYRDQAESYARQQVELIRELDVSDQLSGYKDNSFCIDPGGLTGPSKQSVAPATGMCPLPISGTAGQFSVVDSYSGDCAASTCTKTYTVTVKWPSSNASAPNAVTLYYKPKNSYVPCTAAGSCPLIPPTSSPTTPPPGGWPAFSTDLGDNPTIADGQTIRLIWTTSPAASYCKGSWTGGTLAPSNPSGDAVSPHSTTTYTLTCYNVAGVPKSATQLVTVTPQPIMTKWTADSYSLSYNTSTIIRWDTSNATKCWRSGGSWGNNPSTNIGTTGTYNTGNLTSSASYSITCSGLPLTTPVTPAPINISVSPPPAPYMNYFYPSPNNICYGCSTALYWSSSNTSSCTWGGPVGSVGTGALYGNTGYTINCSGPGGSTSASTTVYVNPPPPPPPPPPPSCSAYAGGWRSANLVWISGGGSGCSYFYDSIVGWNGGGTWGPIDSWGTVCHTQQGGVDPWGWLSSSSWCG